MLKWLATLTLNQILALLAFVLGFVAVGARVDHGNLVTLDLKEMALLVQKEADHVAPLELADWIIKEKPGYRLIDLRDAPAYATYHIPTAEHVTVADLPDAPLGRNETVVLYSEGGIHAAQAWFLLKAKGYPSVLTVKGGLDGWKDEVLFPAVPEGPASEEQARLERVQAVSRFFGGRPRAAGGTASSPAPMELPKVAPPAPSAALGGAPPKRGKKEGC